MGNRHHHKKLRAEVRARMARTGESYQKALGRILDERAGRWAARDVDLVPFEYFGAPATLATFEILGRLACVVLSSGRLSGAFPGSPLVSLGGGGRRGEQAVIGARSKPREVTMSTSTRDRVGVFREHGFFVVPGFLGVGERGELRRACDVALRAARALSRETGHSTPRISLLGDGASFREDPGAMEHISAFASSQRVCALLRGLSRPGEEEIPRLADAHYYHEQTRRDWDGDWHRDSQFGRPDPEAEREVVAATTAVHVRVALEDDDRLEIVPGSHARWDAPAEMRIRKGADRVSDDMPNAVRVVLRAGDACVFHAWSIHRATYRREPLRRTIDCLYAFARPAARSWSLPGV